MATRVISSNKAVYVTKTGVFNGNAAAGSGVEATQLHRIDNFSYNVDIAGARQDVREFGQLARIATLISSDLTPQCTFGYYLTDGENEHHLGFETVNSLLTASLTPSVQSISGFLSEDSNYRERNIFVVTVGEGNDAFASAAWASPTEHDVVGFGNSFITDYSVDLSVGEIPRADVSFDCGNLRFYTGVNSGIPNPSINPSVGNAADSGRVALPIPSTGDSDVDVLRDGQITLDLQSATPLGIGGVNLASLHPQSVSISVPLAREALRELGSSLPYSRPLTLPIDVTMSVSALNSDLVQGQISTLLTGCAGQEKRDIKVSLFDRCNPTDLKLAYVLRNAVLDSQDFGQDLDGNETVDLQFSAQIGGATTTTAGLFLTGDYNISNGSPLNPTLVAGLTGAN